MLRNVKVSKEPNPTQYLGNEVSKFFDGGPPPLTNLPFPVKVRGTVWINN